MTTVAEYLAILSPWERQALVALGDSRVGMTTEELNELRRETLPNHLFQRRTFAPDLELQPRSCRPILLVKPDRRLEFKTAAAAARMLHVWTSSVVRARSRRGKCRGWSVIPDPWRKAA